MGVTNSVELQFDYSPWVRVTFGLFPKLAPDYFDDTVQGTGMGPGAAIVRSGPFGPVLSVRTVDGEFQPIGQRPSVLGVDGARCVAVSGGGQDDCHVGDARVVRRQCLLHPGRAADAQRSRGHAVGTGQPAPPSPCSPGWRRSPPFSSVTATTISWSTARSGRTVIPSVTSLSVIAVPSRVTALIDAPSSVVIAVSVTGVTSLPTSAAYTTVPDAKAGQGSGPSSRQ